MKIAFFVNQFPSLSETFILNQVTGLLDRGHEVDIYASGPGNEPEIHADVERYGLLKHTYYTMNNEAMPTKRVHRLIRGIGRIAIDCRKKPIVVLNSLNFLKFGKKAVSLRILYQLAPFLDKGPYDIVHCHFGPLGNRALTLKAIGALHGCIVTSFRGYDISKYTQEKGERVYDILFEKGDLFLCVSEEIKSTLLKLSCKAEKIIVHRSGTHLDKFPWHLRRPRLHHKLQVLTISRLVEKKGVEYGIRSVAKVLRKYPAMEYKIAGDGYLRNNLQRLIKELEVDDHVKLIGWQRKDQLRDLFIESDILLAPSVTSQNGDREGIPGAVIEGLAWGLPTISTRHAGIPEVVKDGESGFLVPERDPDALAERLEYLLEHREIWPDMARKGREYVEEHYDINKLNDRLVEIYQQLLHRQRAT